jgi:hypothetical protein
MKRRGFLGVMLGAMAAPAVVKAEHLMKIVVPKQEIILFGRPTPTQFGGELSKVYLDKLHRNARYGAHIGDMDINCMYDRVIPLYDKETLERVARNIKMLHDHHPTGYDYYEIMRVAGHTFVNV